MFNKSRESSKNSILPKKIVWIGKIYRQAVFKLRIPVGKKKNLIRGNWTEKRRAKQ